MNWLPSSLYNDATMVDNTMVKTGIMKQDARQTASEGTSISADGHGGLVSILMPTYNRAHVIVETLESVRSQTYRPIEVIVVDDGSTDNTPEVVAQWASRHGQTDDLTCRLVRQKNAGAGAARNRAIIESRGEFIQFLDSDDLLHKDRLRRVVDAMHENNCEYVETGFDGYGSKCGATVDQHFGHTRTPQLTLLLAGRLWPNTLRATFRRSLVVRTGFWNEEMTALEDYEYAIRALTSVPAPKTFAIRDVLAYARRDSQGSVSDGIRTYPGRKLRIHCEEILCKAISGREDVSDEQKGLLKSRLYTLAWRSSLSGWPDLGQRCGELADSIQAPLDRLGRRRRWVWRSGKTVWFLYARMAKWKAMEKRVGSSRHAQPGCRCAVQPPVENQGKPE